MDLVRVQIEPFDPNHEVDLLRKENPSIGAIVSFLGLMRDMNQGERIYNMTLEHYPEMTEKELQNIVKEAHRRWHLLGCRLIHRIGELIPQDPIVLVAVASEHRGEAFQACEFIIDFLKTRAPFWKKEQTEQGGRWVDAKEKDSRAEKKWTE